MAGFNQVILIGNLTRDPQVKQLPSNTTVADFGLAVTRKFRTQAGEEREETCFVDCTAFGKQAEVIGQYCQKGKQLFVEGRLKYDSWEDKQGFGRRSKVSVVVENFQFLGTRDPAGAIAPPPGRDEPAVKGNEPARSQQRRGQSTKAEQPFSEDEQMFQEADIPF